MNVTSAESPLEAFRALRRLAPKAENVEHCGLCHQMLAPQHDHLLDPRTRRLLCSCQACALLFSGAATQYKRVPKRIRFFPACNMSDAEWDALMIPIGIAFFVKHSPDGASSTSVAAYYPSPAGPVESLLSLDAWQEIESRNPDLDHLQSDTEALLVNRTARESFVLPIDECYRLVGLMRTHWKGLSGGAEVWREIQLFFAEMKARAGV
jgi:Family of unknown function (DUF5947)